MFGREQKAGNFDAPEKPRKSDFVGEGSRRSVDASTAAASRGRFIGGGK